MIGGIGTVGSSYSLGGQIAINLPGLESFDTDIAANTANTATNTSDIADINGALGVTYPYSDDTLLTRIETLETTVPGITTNAGAIADVNFALGIDYPYDQATLLARIEALEAAVNGPVIPETLNYNAFTDLQIQRTVHPQLHKTFMVTNVNETTSLILDLFMDNATDGGWRHGAIFDVCMLRDSDDAADPQYNVKLDLHTSTPTTDPNYVPMFLCNALSTDSRAFSDKWELLVPGPPRRLALTNTFYRFRFWKFPVKGSMLTGAQKASGHFDDPSTTTGYKECLSIVMENVRI